MAYDEPLTLGDIFKKIGDDAIIAEFPNGYKRYLCKHSRLDKSDAALPIVKPYKYDWLSKTYHVKISSLEMYLTKLPKTDHGIDPLKYKMDWCGNMCNDEIPLNGLRIKRIICDGPATIIFWNDGTKTVVKCEKEPEKYDFEKGILYAALKKLTTKKEYDNILRAIDKIENEVEK